MLTGMLLIAKFLVLKLFMSSDVYDFGVIFQKEGVQPNNLKLIGSVIYHLGLRSFVNETVQLKTKDF